MLKNPLPGRARTALGLGLVAVLVMGGSYAAWAAQPAQVSVENADAPASQRIHADVVLSVDGAPLDALWNSHSKGGYFMQHDPKKAPSNWNLGLIAGHPYLLEIQRNDETWGIDVTVRPAADHTFELESTLKHNGTVVGHPRLIVEDGEPAAVQIGSSITVKDGEPVSARGLKLDVTLHKVTDDDVRGWRNKTGGTLALDTGSAPTENESYRRITRIEYPQSAIVENAQGVVYIGVHIGADGKVVDAKVSSVMPMARTDLAHAALAAVKNWTFNPRIVDGKAVAGDTTVSVAFSLDPKKPLTVAPGVLDAIRVSPQNDDAPTAADAPASEKVEYRRKFPPRYPAAAIKAGEQGEVVLKVHVDAKGNPVEALVDKTDPQKLSPDIGNAAIAAVMQWKFNPAHRRGKAVDDWVHVPITFSLTEL